MALPTALQLKWLPTAALGTGVSPAAVAWSNGSWVQFNASTSAVWTLYGITVNAGAANGEFEVDIGYGAAGFEQVITTIRGTVLTLVSHNVFELGVPTGPIPAGSRIAVRLRTAGTTTTAWPISIGYYEGTFDSTHVTPNAQLAAPSAAAGTTLTPSGTSWGNSAYAQVLASAPYDMAITAIPYSPAGTAAVGYELAIATGAAGSETELHAIRGRYDAATGYINNILPVPVFIAAGSRVAIRLRKGNTVTTAWKVAISYVKITPAYNVTHTTDAYKRLNVAPNTPTLTLPVDTGTATSTQPQVTFTATDPDGDTITYQIQIDTVNTFDSQ